MLVNLALNSITVDIYLYATSKVIVILVTDTSCLSRTVGREEVFQLYHAL